MATFAVEKNCHYLNKSEMDSAPLEKTIFLGGLKDWLLCKQIDSLEIISDGDYSLDSARLSCERGLTPQLSMLPQANIAGVDGVFHAGKDGKLYFQFDVSEISGAKSIRVEISPPYKDFCFFGSSSRDTKFCSWCLKSFDINAQAGVFALSDRLGSPVPHQVRIFARAKNGDVVGYSSDPIYVQSVPGACPQTYYSLVFNSNTGAKDMDYERIESLLRH